jgi:hypothetical protein
MVTLVRIALRLIEDALRWVVLLFRSTESVHAENLFLRRQLALYIASAVSDRAGSAPMPRSTKQHGRTTRHSRRKAFQYPVVDPGL